MKVSTRHLNGSVVLQSSVTEGCVLLLLLLIVEGPNQFNEKNEALERKKENVFA